MTLDETMATLESLGTAQNRKVYARHGAPAEMFGVSFANFGKLAKKIKTDHALAVALWGTGNADARQLACMIADPAQTTAKLLNAWVRDCTYYGISDSVSQLASKTSHARACMERWITSKAEFTSTAGWYLVALLSADRAIPDSFFEQRVADAEANIHKAPNRTRYSMNVALINIGLRNATLKKQVLAAAKRIGPVEVDHGETGCKTPAIADYIARTEAYRATKKPA